MKAFFDTSALVKRYVEEGGSDEVKELLQKTTELGLSLLVVPECISSFSRLRRSHQLTSKQYHQIKEDFLTDIIDVSLCGITQKSVQRALHLLESYPLKTLDALHIASALEWQAEYFISADVQQIKVAKSNKLKVITIYA